MSKLFSIFHEPDNAKNMDYKTLGNDCFSQKQFSEAIKFYTKGLRVCKKEDSINLYSNRAMAYIKLDCFRQGLADTDAVLAQNPEHEKGIFRHVKCLWGLGQYEEALSFINSKLSKYSHLFQNQDLLRARKQAEVFLEQSKTGKYDIVQLMRHQQASPLEPLEVGEYVGPVQIRDVEGKGRGLITTDSVVSGQLILCCKPFAFYGYDRDDLASKVNFALVDQIVEKINVDPQLRKQIFPLHAPDSASVKFSPWVDITPEEKIDDEGSNDLDSGDSELVRLHAIVANNSFEFNGSGALIESDQAYFWSGLWILPSYINHSCSEANATWAVYGDTFFVRAVRPIAAGEEIQISYVNITWPYKDRCGVITDHKFVCSCNLCEYEKGEMEEVKEKRDIIIDKLREIYYNEETMPKQVVLDLFMELESLRKEKPELNFCLANVTIVNLAQRLLQERDGQESLDQCRYILEKIHSVVKNTAHAKFVVQICIDVFNCVLEDETSETRTIQTWIKQLKDDLTAAHGSPRALQCLNPDLVNLLQDLMHANEFL